MCYRFFCSGILPNGKKHTAATLDRSDKGKVHNRGIDRRYVAGDNGKIMTGVA